MIKSVEEMIQQYVAAWNETSLDDYLREFAKCWASDAIYIDPYSEKISGVEGLSEFAQKSLEIIPTRKFEISEKPDYHHNFGKYTWSVSFSGQKNVGYDYFEFNEDFKITRLISFFKLPEDYPLEKLV